MEKLLPNMEKVEENYKVPNLEKGIAVLEYLSLRSAGGDFARYKVCIGYIPNDGLSYLEYVGTFGVSLF